MIVTPRRTLLYLDDAEAIHEVTSKREAFPKPTGSYRILTLYGDSVLTSEGAVWRLHRRVTSASFNERNAALVFRETVHQTRGLVTEWRSRGDGDNGIIGSLEHDCMALTLNIIGYVGFGLRLLWPGQTLPPGTDPRLAKYASLDAPEGHTMSFADSLRSTLDHLLLLMLFPKWALSTYSFPSAVQLFPFLASLPRKGYAHTNNPGGGVKKDNCMGQVGKKAVESENNYVQYMNEFLQDKIEDVRKGNAEEGMDIMGQLVRTSYGDSSATAANGHGGGGSRKEAKVALPDSEIIGNAFSKSAKE